MSRGRGVWFKKNVVEECWSLDMKTLKRHIDFDKRSGFTSRQKSTWGRKITIVIVYLPRDPFRIYYNHFNRDTEKNDLISYRIPWEATECNYGGLRYWFKCPNCRSRRRVLYLPYGGKYFACRDCYNLCYESQQEGKSGWYVMRKALTELHKIEQQYYRARSPRRKAILKRKLDRIYDSINQIKKFGMIR